MNIEELVDELLETDGIVESTSVEELEEGFLRDGWVKVKAYVKKLLPDDVFGRKHQRFVVGLGGKKDGDNVLVAHSIDAAKRAPVNPGDIVKIRGKYKVDLRTGKPLIHFTHRPQRPGSPGGWIAKPNAWMVQ